VLDRQTINGKESANKLWNVSAEDPVAAGNISSRNDEEDSWRRMTLSKRVRSQLLDRSHMVVRRGDDFDSLADLERCVHSRLFFKRDENVRTIRRFHNHQFARQHNDFAVDPR